MASYLRFTRSSPRQWLGSIKVLLGLPRIEFSFPPSVKSFPGVSELNTGSGSVFHMAVDGPTGVIVKNAKLPILVWVCSGRIQNKEDVFLIRSGEEVGLATDGHSVLTIIQFPESEVAAFASHQRALDTYQQRQQVRWLLEDYNLRSQFFPDHDRALSNTRAMLAELTACLTDRDCRLSLPRRRVIDPKFEQAVNFIANNPGWEFSLKDLTNIVHSSERTLYYQMKRVIGMTPYRYYQRCKLLRLRLALLDCEADSPSISWHALEHGLNHLGRLPALYASHFGEKPSETLTSRKALRMAGELALSATLRPVTAGAE
ncbi:helix-turn-helix domain-containing protein [Saccharospirillum impatiens]|uniref:helix-turn-helix domain-containing protein n=1 Tax=Saccharospirillum impatiens TaxID=169438 RepID=UPI000425A4F3|nr:helix-turn-helix domain-containing protein [Saccharospirillum impatiens]